MKAHFNSTGYQQPVLKSRHLARVTSDETLYYGTDHQGTTVLMTDEAGVKVWTSEATPFGDAIVTKTGDRDDLALKYTGKDLDEDTGLYYYNARWYDASTGRFISEDPARAGANWFVYCSNNPINFIDPTGMWDSSGSANDNPYDDGGDATRDDNINSPRGPADDGGGSKEPEPKPEEKKKSFWEKAKEWDRKWQTKRAIWDLPKDVKELIKKDANLTVKFFGEGTGGSIAFVGGEGDQFVRERVTVTFFIEETGQTFSATYISSISEVEGLALGAGPYTISMEGTGIYPAGTTPSNIALDFQGTSSGYSFSIGPFGISGYSSKNAEYAQGTFGFSKGLPVSFTKEKSSTVMVQDSFKELPLGEPQYWADQREWMSRP